MAVKERKDRIKSKPLIDEVKIDRRLAATEALVRLIKGIAGELDGLEIETMTKAIDAVLNTSDISEEESALALKLTGRQYSKQDAVVLEITSLMRYFDKRKELLQNSLTASTVAELLGTTRQTPHDRMNNKSLLAVKDNGVWKFPSWQFDPSGADGVIDGLPEVLKALEGSEFTKLNWLVSPNCYLENLTPVEALKQGLKAKVLKEAIALGTW
ncbi:MAG: DNA-binding protein [Chroococcus sp. CMT-3BRIN-NPC107]|jgi:hypothetical protein|nr:DNA-binding protein [Chroococcus sp. CMT-3BRIN-NPC107]